MHKLTLLRPRTKAAVWTTPGPYMEIYWLILGHVQRWGGWRSRTGSARGCFFFFFKLSSTYLILHWWGPFLLLSIYLANNAYPSLVFLYRPTQANLPVLAGNLQKWFPPCHTSKNWYTSKVAPTKGNHSNCQCTYNSQSRHTASHFRAWLYPPGHSQQSLQTHNRETDAAHKVYTPDQPGPDDQGNCTSGLHRIPFT